MLKIKFLLITISISHVLFGQTSILDSSINIQEVLVTASRRSQIKRDINLPIQTISAHQLQTIASRNLPDALMHQGLWIQKTNQGGGSPFIRGLTGNQVLIMKDGIRLNNSIYRYGPNQYLSLQSTTAIDQIDILRGSGSVQYGSDAIGGVINLISEKPLINHANAFYGSVNTQWATQKVEQIHEAYLGWSKKNYGLTVRSSWEQYGDSPGGSKTGIQKPSGYDQFNTEIKGRIKNRAGLWDLSYSLINQSNVPVYHKIVLEGFHHNQSDVLRHQLVYLRNKYDFGISSIFKNIETTISLQTLKEDRSLQKKTDLLRHESDEVRVFSMTFQAEIRPAKNMHSVLGTDMYRDIIHSSVRMGELVAGSPILRGLYPEGTTYLNMGFFNNWNFQKNHWIVDLGWRWNVYQLNAHDKTLGEVSLKPSALVWNGALGRSFGDHHVFVHLDKTYRAPNVDDAGTLGIVDFRYEVPNYNLNPEQGIQWSTGYRYSGKNLKMEHALFYLKLEDLITRTATQGDSIQGYPVFIKKNSERAFIYGIESSVDLTLLKFLVIEAKLQYAFGQNQSIPEPIRRIPPLYYITQIKYQPSTRWSAYLESMNAAKQTRLSAGDLSDNRISKTGTPAWHIINLGLSYRYRFISTRLGIENIFNVDYRVHGSGINGAGRIGRMGLKVEW